MRPGGTFDTKYTDSFAVIRTRFQWLALILFLIFVATVPIYAPSSILAMLNIMFITIVSVHGLNLITGYTGQISIGQAGFMACGAYALGIFYGHFGVPFLVALPCAALAAGLVGLVFGLPSLRLKGFYLVMSTLAAQFIIIWLIVHLPAYTGGVNGLHVPRPEFGGLVIRGEIAFYFVNLGFAIAATYALKNLVRSRVGRAFVAVRDNDLAAAAMGVNAFRYKLISFFVSSTFAGLAGALWASYLGVIHPDHFHLMKSIWYLGMIIVGGMGSVAGGIFGVIMLKGLDQLVITMGPAIGNLLPQISNTVTAAMAVMMFGLIILLFLIFEPRGLAHRWELIKSSTRLWPLSY